MATIFVLVSGPIDDTQNSALNNWVAFLSTYGSIVPVLIGKAGQTAEYATDDSTRTNSYMQLSAQRNGVSVQQVANPGPGETYTTIYATPGVPLYNGPPFIGTVASGGN